MRTFIKVSDPLRRDLVNKFKVSKPTVWAALNYITRGGNGPAIRRYALSHGGAIVEEDFMPNCRTEHTQEEMIQTFAGGIQVRVSKVNSGAVILRDGKEVERYEELTLKAWGNLLYHAQELSQEQVASNIAKS